jgi:hypothetical protein
MNWRSKYIIIDYGMNVVPIVFSELQQHAEVARALYATPDKILGAGFCFIEVVKITNQAGQTFHEPRYKCYGESVSLKVKSREDEDSRFLNKYLGVTTED